jgi:hypothetical protein
VPKGDLVKGKGFIVIQFLEYLIQGFLISLSALIVERHRAISGTVVMFKVDDYGAIGWQSFKFLEY